MSKFRNVYMAFRDGSGPAKYVLYGSLLLLLVSIINFSGLALSLNFPLFLFPIFWLVWMVIYLGSVAPTFRSTMQIAWIIIAIAVLFSLLEQVYFNSWHTQRQYVIMQDLTVLALAPFCFPAGIIPDFLGNAIELIPFVGDGAVHRFEISHGLGIFVVLTWGKYCCATIFETFAILNIVDRIRRKKPRLIT